MVIGILLMLKGCTKIKRRPFPKYSKKNFFKAFNKRWKRRVDPNTSRDDSDIPEED